MELNTKIYLLDDKGEKFMGIGVLWLLEAIAESSSLRQAAQKMELSYSKAYSMIARLEKSLGKKIVDRKRGGHSREGVELTEFAKEFIVLYKEFQGRIKSETAPVFEEFKESLNLLMEDKNVR